MPTFPALRACLSRLTIITVQSNEVHASAFRKRLPDDHYDHGLWWIGKKEETDGHFYCMLMHGEDKYYRPIVTGHEQFVTQSSAQLAGELLLKYIRQMDPWTPEGDTEDQLPLFEELPLACVQVA